MLICVPIWFQVSDESHGERKKRWASAASSPPSGFAKLIALDVICGKDHMTVRAEFNGPFNGIVFSKGTYGQDNCVYVKPYSAVTHTTFKVNYDACGTKPDLQGKYYENTIVVQYGTDIIEAWDEAKRLRCEWFEAYEKPATFRPAIPVADLDVIEMNFQGDDIDCWMEIQEGKGPWAREVNRIVPVGQPMTIVVSINDYNGQFDMRVKSCFAHDGVKQPIQLTDDHGCVLRPKMLSGFHKIKDPNGKATVISYSHFYAFKFPDTMNVQIQCTVEVCRHGCPDACHKGPYPAPVREIHPKISIGTSGSLASASNVHTQTASHQNKVQAAVTQKEEPKPVYRDAVPSQQANTDQAMLNHATQFLADQGIDLSAFRAGLANSGSASFFQDTSNPFGEESRDQPQFAIVNATSDSSGSPVIAVTSASTASEDDSKPVIKVLEIDVPSDKKKPPTITEQSSIFPADLSQANKILADLGLNMDLNSFASSFVKNPKDLSSLLQNDQIKQLAAANGINLNGLSASSFLPPDAQPLVTNSTSGLVAAASNQDIEVIQTTRIPGPVYESEMETVQQNQATPAHAQHQPNRTTPQPALNHFSPQMPVHNHLLPQHRMPVRPIVHNHHIPHSPPRGHPHNQMPPHLPPQQLHHAPVVNIMNIPMQPGMPASPVPPAFTNFVHLPPNMGIPPPKHPKRPLFHIPSFHLPPLPSFSSLNPFANHFSHSKDRREDLSGGAQVRSEPQMVFPQGPRSLRLRRSIKSGEDNSLNVNKGFQVVTAIDLAFFPNVTDVPEFIEGRREELVHGVCMPMIAFAAAITCILLFIICSLVFSAVMVHKLSRRSTKQNFDLNPSSAH